MSVRRRGRVAGRPNTEKNCTTAACLAKLLRVTSREGLTKEKSLIVGTRHPLSSVQTPTFQPVTYNRILLGGVISIPGYFPGLLWCIQIGANAVRIVQQERLLT